jgi:hypothetical protein
MIEVPTILRVTNRNIAELTAVYGLPPGVSLMLAPSLIA